MRSFTVITAVLLCSHIWICGSQTVEVQSGEDVTLLCSNMSTSPTQTDWFRVVNRTKVSCISSMHGAHGVAFYCDGFQQERFEMSSNISTISLQIRQVEPSDSGLYFCGFYIRLHVILSSATELIVLGNDDETTDMDHETTKPADGLMDLGSWILGVLSVFLTAVIIVLAVKLRRLQKAVSEEHRRPEEHKTRGSEDLNYAALSFQTKAKRSCRPVSHRETEPHVVYAATR